MKDLNSRGVGGGVKRAEALTKEDEEICWKKGLLGNLSANALLNTVYFYNCKFFHLCASDEHRRIKIQDIQIGSDSHGKYLHFTGNMAKNNQGSHSRNFDAKTIRQYQPKDGRDVVSVFEEYKKLIEDIDDNENGPFYRRPLANLIGTARFSKQPIGINYLAKIIPAFTAQADLKGQFTGHSGKATGITQLYESGISEEVIQKRSGNRSLSSLRVYNRPGKNVPNIMASEALSAGSSSSCCKVANLQSTANKLAMDEFLQNDEDDENLSEVLENYETVSYLKHGVFNNCTFNFN